MIFLRFQVEVSPTQTTISQEVSSSSFLQFHVLFFLNWMLQEIHLKSSNKLGPKLKRAMAFVSSRELLIVSFMSPRECAKRIPRRFQRWPRSLPSGALEGA